MNSTGKSFSGATRAWKGLESPVSVVPGCSATQIVRCRRNSRAQVTVAWFKAAFDKRYEYQPPARTRRWRRGRREKVSDADDAPSPLSDMDPTLADRFATTDAGRAFAPPRRPACNAFRRAFVTRIGPAQFTSTLVSNHSRSTASSDLCVNQNVMAPSC